MKSMLKKDSVPKLKANNEFKIGDVVWHKASNQQMVVVPDRPSDLPAGRVRCEYSHDGQYISRLFEKSSLKG